jgi:hypothetical protein
MIHLKRFNETVSDLDLDLNLIRKFCYENLAYLFDGTADIDFKYFRRNDDYGFFTIIIENINSKWLDIEADICPFLELLEENYDLVDIVLNKPIVFEYTNVDYILEKEVKSFSVNEILSGGIDENSEISKIRFLIKI